jgi:hypothetical protein
MLSGKLEILIEALLFWDILEPNPDTGITIVFELSYREFYEICLYFKLIDAILS